MIFPYCFSSSWIFHFDLYYFPFNCSLGLICSSFSTCFKCELTSLTQSLSFFLKWTFSAINFPPRLLGWHLANSDIVCSHLCYVQNIFFFLPFDVLFDQWDIGKWIISFLNSGEFFPDAFLLMICILIAIFQKMYFVKLELLNLIIIFRAQNIFHIGICSKCPCKKMCGGLFLSEVFYKRQVGKFDE